MRTLGDDDPRTALVEVFDDPVRIEGFVGDQRAEFNVLDQRGNANRVVTLSGQEDEADQIAEGIGQREGLGGPAAFRLASGLALIPPFASWPWRWTLTLVPSNMPHSLPGSSDTASNILLKTSACTQSR